MKYFDRDWCKGNLDDEEIQKRYNLYVEYIESIYKEIPFTLKILIKNLNLHDGLVTRIIYKSDNAEFTMRIICGDLELGYFNLCLKYYGVKKMDREYLNKICNKKNVGILYDEIELFKGELSHRLILNNCENEIEIQFNNLEIDIKNELACNYKKRKCLAKIV